MRTLSVVADLIVLNLLTAVCSLPIFTAGAAITALNTVVIRVIRGEEGSLTKDFFRAFRSNFKKATLLWLLVLLAAVLLATDYLAARMYIPALCPVIIAIAVLALMLVIYIFALQARYENTLGRTLKNAAAIAVAFFPRTLGMVVFTVLFWALSLQFLRYGAPILLMFGLSLPGYVCMLLMNPIFVKLETAEPD